VVPSFLQENFVCLRFVARGLKLRVGVNPSHDRVEAIAGFAFFIGILGDLAQLLLEAFGEGLVMLDIFLGGGVGFAFDEDRIREFLGREAGLISTGNMIEKEGLQDFDSLVMVDLEGPFGQAVDLALALLVGAVLRFAFGLDCDEARRNAAGVLLVANGFVEQLPKPYQFPALNFDLVLQGLMHEVNGRPCGGEFVGNGTEDFKSRAVEWKEMLKVLLANVLGPGKSALVVLIIIAHRRLVRDFADAGEDDVVVVFVFFEELDEF
jgi:hypothetical protein